MIKLVLTVFAALFLVNPTYASGPYAGYEERAISTLSPKDIADIRAGRGWSLALPAEINGYPGPIHVLELAEKMHLDADQAARVKAILYAMNAAARDAGGRYIEAERALDAAFRAGKMDRATLAARIAEAETWRARLREIHLAAHLETAAVLSAHQRELYATLRGYRGGDAHKSSGHRH